MTRYQKKFVFQKVTDILNSNSLIIIGAYDVHKQNILDECQSSVYIPKNSISSLVGNFSKVLFQGPIFLLSTNNSTEFVSDLAKLSTAQIPVYGGLYNKSLLNFADIKELASLLANKNSKQLIYSKWQTIMASNFSFLLPSGVLNRMVTPFNKAVSQNQNKKNKENE